MSGLIEPPQSIGTEDSEVLAYRAEHNDWMPRRLYNVWGRNGKNWGNIVKYVDFGLMFTLPPLQKGEKIYFHNIVAEGSIYGDDISTNIMVDQSKKDMLNILGLDL